MGDRGRKSGSELTTTAAIEKTERAKPLPGMTQAQGDIWLDIVYRLPAEWFPRETHEILAQYCRHCDSAAKVAQLIEKAESEKDFDVDAYDQLLKMQEREGRAMSSLATRMRITQQATYDPKKKKGSTVERPWEN